MDCTVDDILAAARGPGGADLRGARFRGPVDLAGAQLGDVDLQAPYSTAPSSRAARSLLAVH